MLNAVASAATSSLLRRASQVVRSSKLAFWASISARLREYDNILCPSLCWNDLSSQAPHKSSLLRENFKITFKSVLGHIQFVLMLVLHFAKSRDVTSLLKWVYIPYVRVNCSKTIPFTAAHTYMAHIWQYPPRGKMLFVDAFSFS